MTYSYKLALTVEALRALVLDSEHLAHAFLWSDGAYTWTLDNLLDATIDGLNSLDLSDVSAPMPLIEIEASDLSDKGKKQFVSGYCAAAPDGYNFEADTQTDCPWCAPWEFGVHWHSVFQSLAVHADYEPEAMGRLRAQHDYNDLSLLLLLDKLEAENAAEVNA